MTVGRWATIAKPIRVTGVGIHTGTEGAVTLAPAPFGAGLVFRREDVAIPAEAACVVDTSRCTVLGKQGITISTVEHLLSACAGLGITDLSVEVDGPELPIGDGSALVWTNALQNAGRVLGDDLPPAPRLDAPMIVTGKGGAFVAAYPSDALRVTVAVSFEHPLVGTQVARFDASRDEYVSAVAPARTFGFIEEVEALRAAGLARGGSFDNAVVVYPDHYSTDLRFPEELARHKLLDVMGDLLLSGIHGLRADIIAVKPSHRLNTQFAAQLAALQV